MDDPDEPLKSEVEAQSEQTIMPWIWGAIGLLLIAVFVAWAFLGAPHTHIRQPPAAAPVTRPAS